MNKLGEKTVWEVYEDYKKEHELYVNVFGGRITMTIEEVIFLGSKVLLIEAQSDFRKSSFKLNIEKSKDTSFIWVLYYLINEMLYQEIINEEKFLK